MEGGAVAGAGRFGPDAAAVGGDDAATDVEAEARAEDAALRRVSRPVEALEDGAELVLGHADASIPDGNVGVAVEKADSDLHPLRRRAVLQRVGDEVLEDLLDARLLPVADKRRLGGR